LRAELVGKDLLLASTPPAEQTVLTMDMTGSGNTYPFQAPRSGYLNVTATGEGESIQFELYDDQFLPVAFGQNGRLSVRVEQGQVYLLYATGSGQPIEIHLGVADQPLDSSTPTTITTDALDVNDDGMLTPRDALAVINWINQHVGSQAAKGSSRSLDVNVDGIVSALDVLRIINGLNSLAVVTEGELVADQDMPPEGLHVSMVGGSVDIHAGASRAVDTKDPTWRKHSTEGLLHFLRPAVSGMCGVRAPRTTIWNGIVQGHLGAQEDAITSIGGSEFDELESILATISGEIAERWLRWD
jgi:hypothetical protein